MQRRPWLLLLYGLPAEAKAERISLWRKLKKCGALAFKTSAYILPDQPMHLERFQWLAKQVRDAGGEATLLQVAKIEGVTDAQIIELFNAERGRDYEDLVEEVKALKTPGKQKELPEHAAAMERLKRRFQEIRAIDFFSSPSAHDAEMALSRKDRVKVQWRTAKRDDFQNKEWLTRPRPEIDRVGSAWLIQRFIDAEARFVFSASVSDHPDAIPYDMNDVEFTHHGEDCTFETLIKRFKLTDKRLKAISEMIHDADLEDGKFQRAECVGLDRMFKGYGAMGLKDEEILKRGFEAFDGLYAALR